VREAFERYGPVKTVQLVKDTKGIPRGYGFVEFVDPRDMTSTSCVCVCVCVCVCMCMYVYGCVISFCEYLRPPLCVCVRVVCVSVCE
jgi:RNA recognition motif